MWLSGQQKLPNYCGEGQTGIVTMSKGKLAVKLETERRGLEVYAPAGYHWTPQAGQRVLVIQGQGEIPGIVGVRNGGGRPDSVGIEAKELTLTSEETTIYAEKTVTVQTEKAVTVEAEKTVTVKAGKAASVEAEETVAVKAKDSASLEGGQIALIKAAQIILAGQVYVGEEKLEKLIERIAKTVLEGGTVT